jgi:hypothetical protein
MWKLSSFVWGYCWCKIGAQFAPNVPSAQKSFWTHSVVLIGDMAQVKAQSIQRALIWTQDRCTVYVEHSIGSEIILDHLMELLGDVGHVESHFFLFGDIVSVSAR